MHFLQFIITSLLATQLQVENGELKENTMYNNSEKPFRVHFYVPAKEEVNSIQWQVEKYSGTIDEIQKEGDTYHAYVDLPKDTQWQGKLTYNINEKEFESDYDFCFDTINDASIRFEQEGKKEEILYFFGKVKGSIEGEECEVQWYRNGKTFQMDANFEIDQSGRYKVVCTDASHNRKTFEFDVEMDDTKIWMEDDFLCIRDRNFDETHVECALLKSPQWIHQEEVHKVNIKKGLQDGNYEVFVRYMSKAGRIQEFRDTFSIDTTPPYSVQIQYDFPVQTKENKLYYNSPFKIHIQTKDEISEIRKIDWQYGSQKGSVQDQNEIQIECKDEEASKLYIQVQDTMGNTKKYESEEIFILDMTAPHVSIHGLEATYYPEKIQAKIQVEEANFDASQFHVFDEEEIEVQWKDNIGTFIIEAEGKHHIRIEYKDNSQNASNVDGWTSEEKIIDVTPPLLKVVQNPPYREQDGVLYYSKPIVLHTLVQDASPSEVYATISDEKIKVKDDLVLKEDGQYEIQFQSVDAAKHRSERIQCKPMILDTHISEPSITLQGKNTNPHIFSSKVKIEAECQDENYDKSTMQVSYEDIYGKQKVWNEPVHEGKDTFFYKKDGKYDIQIQMKDKAGNTTNKSAHFIINQNGSRFVYDPYIHAVSNQTIKQLDQTLKIQEYNVNPTQSQLVILKDGKVLENIKYAKIGNTYHIFTSNFKKDGIYKVRLHTLDEAGHENHLQDEIYFKIDKTPPEIHIHSLYHDLDAIEYRLFDTMGLNRIQIFADGQEVEKIENLKGIHSYIQELAHENKKIEIVATDEAGNENRKQFQTKNVHAKEVKMPDFTPYLILLAISIGCVIKYKKE